MEKLLSEELSFDSLVPSGRSASLFSLVKAYLVFERNDSKFEEWRDKGSVMSESEFSVIATISSDVIYFGTCCVDAFLGVKACFCEPLSRALLSFFFLLFALTALNDF
jgi:hypothetical protein